MQAIYVILQSRSIMQDNNSISSHAMLLIFLTRFFLNKKLFQVKPMSEKNHLSITRTRTYAKRKMISLYNHIC
jgi:hypothetical protein